MSLFLLKNTSDDRAKVTLHRSAASMTAVINIAGVRLDPGMQMYVEKEHFERIRDQLVKQYQDGSLEVVEVEPKEGVELRVLAPERIPTPHVNPHGEFNPQAQKINYPTNLTENQDEVLKLLEKPLPGTPVIPAAPPGADLANPNIIQPITPEVSGAVVPRPPIEQAILPGEVLPREAHIHVEGEQGPPTQPIESLPEISGPDAPTHAPPIPPPDANEPRRPDTAGGEGVPPTVDENAPKQSDEKPAPAEPKPGAPTSPHTAPHGNPKHNKKKLM
jgi:hypothetical protein